MRKDLDTKKVGFPMPVLVIATYNEDYTVNAMTAAWGTLEDRDVVLLELARDHKTSENIKRTKSFTLSFADVKHVKQADYFGIVSGRNVKNKFERSKLTALPSSHVDAPVIQEFPITLDCMVMRIDETDGDFAVYGKVMNVSADENILTDGKIDMDKAKLICYSSSDTSYRLFGEKVDKAYNCGFKYK